MTGALFLDTSALVRLYVVESNSETVRGLVTDADSVLVCRIAWAEAFAAFARREREVPEDAGPLLAARKALADDWPRFVVVEVSQSVVQRAGEFAQAFALRAYDSIQLAAAMEAFTETRALDFACFDIRLNSAARVLGMDVPCAG